MKDNQPGDLLITSPAFEEEGNIPAKYTCEGEEISPPIKIKNIPDGTRTLAIVAEDPDAPRGIFDHWVAWNIPVSASIEENTAAGTRGVNDSGKTGYHGPCPPEGSHRYYFYVYALDAELELAPGAGKKALLKAIAPHILSKGSLMARYQKLKK
ncbi:MAG: YbhB/YbcL family Raf kinase inhibitor-like protein [Bacteroidota bacterium]